MTIMILLGYMCVKIYTFRAKTKLKMTVTYSENIHIQGKNKTEDDCNLL